MSGETFLIVGLGNPGKEYIGTRHNVGFDFVDLLRKANFITSEKEKFHSLLSECQINGSRFFLAKPTTYMNRSGLSVRMILDFYKIPLTNLIVIHDDLDLDIARVKIKRGGGHAGHNGLKSLDQHIGKDYLRIRIGIGRPEYKGQVSDYVLGKFSKEDIKKIEEKISKIVDNIDKIFDENIEFYNQILI